jgi:hypothetical protein
MEKYNLSNQFHLMYEKALALNVQDIYNKQLAFKVENETNYILAMEKGLKINFKK